MVRLEHSMAVNESQYSVLIFKHAGHTLLICTKKEDFNQK